MRSDHKSRQSAQSHASRRGKGPPRVAEQFAPHDLCSIRGDGVIIRSHRPERK